jgi:hypothetical protein
MKKMLALMFKGTVDAALKYLRSRLLQIERIHPTEFILSTDYRGGYAEGANIPLKKIARFYNNSRKNY